MLTFGPGPFTGFVRARGPRGRCRRPSTFPNELAELRAPRGEDLVAREHETRIGRQDLEDVRPL